MSQRVRVEDQDAKLIDWEALFFSVASPFLRPLFPQTIRTLYSALTTSYAIIGQAEVQAKSLQIFNSLGSASSVDIGISLDGVTDNWRLEAGEGFDADLIMNKSQLVPGSRIWAKYYTSTGYVQPNTGTLRIILL
jgi:hypothetical protein